jgi:Holliday junction resolvase RusA-like endonuclease
MTIELDFVIGTQPRPCLRAKARIITVNGNKPFASFYDPQPNKEYKAFAQAELIAQMGMRAKLNGPCSVSLVAIFRRPASLPKAGKPHTVKPDVDNIAKIVLDSMNGIVFEDDKLVTSLKITKRYAEIGEEERVLVRLAGDYDNGSPRGLPSTSVGIYCDHCGTRRDHC